MLRIVRNHRVPLPWAEQDMRSRIERETHRVLNFIGAGQGAKLLLVQSTAAQVHPYYRSYVLHARSCCNIVLRALEQTVL
jgi:hypothetical protein